MKTGTRVAPPTSRKKILIVDDHPVLRRGLSELIGKEPDLTVCGAVENAQLALNLIASLQPDLVLADVSMPGKSGLELIKEMRKQQPGLAILVFSMHDETVYAERMLQAGARGYIMKSRDGNDLLCAIRRVLEGKIYVSEEMSNLILDRFSDRPVRASHSEISKLTDREFEVFQLIGQGLTSREIGKRLFISPKTVDTHRLHIKEKLQLESMPEMIKFAVRWVATQDMI